MVFAGIAGCPTLPRQSSLLESYLVSPPSPTAMAGISRARIDEVLAQEAGRDRQRRRVANSELQRPPRQGLVQSELDDIEVAGVLLRDAVWYQRDAEVRLHHVAHGVEAGHADAKLERMAELARGLRRKPVDGAAGLQADEVILDYIGEAYGRPPGKRMVFVHDDREKILAVGHNVEIGRRHATPEDADLAKIVGDSLHDVGGDVLLDLDLHQWMVRQERDELLRQVAQDRRGVGEHFHSASQAV